MQLKFILLVIIYYPTLQHWISNKKYEYLSPKISTPIYIYIYIYI